MRLNTRSLLALVPLLFACENQPVAPTPSALAGTASPASANAASAATASDIAALRRLVAPFHDFDTAVAAGWSVPVTACFEAPGVGAMGFHYGNLAYIGDGGVVDLLQPELLLFEPQQNGKMRFVGVEYIVPYTDLPESAEPPTLLGQPFERVPSAGLWGLHIWVGRENPTGIFMPWNPKVSCDYAPAAAATTAHRHGA